MIATFIRGKHKREYTQRRYDLGDKCVVVNASHIKVTGRKMDHKLYRHHTGYPSGLKEIVMKDLIERRPEEIIERAVKGMMPPNKIRKSMLRKNLIIHEGPYHPHHLSNKLPQFMK